MIRPLPAAVPRGRCGAGLTVLGMVTAVVLGGAIVFEPLVVAVVVPAVAVLLVVIATSRALTPAGDSALQRWVLRWTLAAFALHLLIGLVILSSSSLTTYFGGDSATYSTGAVGILQHWTQGTPSPGHLPTGKTGFYYLLAALFVGFGAHPQVGVVVNAAMAALVIPLLSDTTSRHLGRGATRAVPVVATLLPGFLIWGSQLLREAGVYFLIAVSLNCAVRLLQRSSVSAAVVMVAAIGLLVTFRADVGLVLGGALGIAITLRRRQMAGGLASGLGTVVLLLALMLGGGLGYSGYRFVTHSSYQQVDSIRTDSSYSASSGYLRQRSVSTAQHAAAYIPLGSVYFLLGPAPWQVHGGRQALSLPDVVVWWALLPSLGRGVREACKRRGREVATYLLPALALTAVLALIVANFGTAVRERMQIVIVLVPLIGLGWSVRHPRADQKIPVLTSGSKAS